MDNTDTDTQRMTAYAQAHPDVAAACVAVLRSQQPDPDAALVAQDHGLLDYNRHTGWSLYSSGVQLADHVLTAQETPEGRTGP